MNILFISLLSISVLFAVQPSPEEVLRNNCIIIINDSTNHTTMSWVQAVQYAKRNGLSTQNDFIMPVILGHALGDTGTYSVEDFQEYLFGDTTGSLSDYYDEISYGAFSLTGQVYGWFETSKPIEEYSRSYELGVDILEVADQTIDFSQYDNDGPDGIPNSGDDDTVVDGMALVFPGINFAAYATYGWSGYSNDPSYIENRNISFNRKMFIGEIEYGGTVEGYDDKIAIGTYAHEFGHILGLPDLYDGSSVSFGIGRWCVMSYQLETPAHMSGWGKIKLGWVTPTILNSDMKNVSFPAIESTPFVLKIFQDDYYSDQYFLIENRQKIKYDDNEDFPGTGLVIYHVNEKRRSKGNMDFQNKFIDIEEADGMDDLDNRINTGDDGDPFPGSTGNTEFSDFTYPDSWAPISIGGAVSGISLKYISESSSIMTADVEIKEQLGYAIHYDEEGITGHRTGYQDSIDTWGGVLFTTSEPGYLTEVDVGFLPIDTTTAYQIFVYDSFDGTTPGELVFESDIFQVKFWEYIPITIDNVPVAENQSFFVAVKVFETAYSLSKDYLGEKSGNSYISNDGVTYSNFNPGSSTHQLSDLNIRAKISYEKKFHNVVPENPFILYPNFPNPFNLSTTIRYFLSYNTDVKIVIYDLLGNQINTPLNKTQEIGHQSVQWNGKDSWGIKMSSGIYFYRLQAEDFFTTGKMVLLK